MTEHALVVVLQRNRTKEGMRESYFKELTNVIVGASKSEMCRASARDPRKSWCYSLGSEGSLEAEFPFPWRT